MARVHTNPIIEGASGLIGGNLVIKTIKGGRVIITSKPTFSEHRVFSQAQKAQQQRFRAGIAYAKAAARQEPIYAQRAEGSPRTAFNVALSDFLHPPEILQVDLAAYTGRSGELIRAQVCDDVCVKRVRVAIVDAEERLIEEGEASRAEGLWWNYQTTANVPNAKVRVRIHAWDLPENEVVKEVQKG